MTTADNPLYRKKQHGLKLAKGGVIEQMKMGGGRGWVCTLVYAFPVFPL